ncbi:MAG: 2-oxo acid dehydrogenase subunit E2 [Planctomycetota bacterium]|jgi:pyruvate dehydrogenase E2 component (dihydrolipoamide acetyltransferase)|nr:2-oxo acid dehydrogenase subunit E2 [Planctomycetota bacterium]
MATKVIMPKQGLQMTEGTITHWLLPEGGAVTRGEPLFEMETDKTTMAIDAAADGVLLKIVRGEGETVPIAELIAVIGAPGEDISALLDQAARLEGKKPAPAVADAEPTPSTPKAAAAAAGKIFATPRARLRAGEFGVDLARLSGSAPDGMVVERDVLAAAASAPKATPLARRVAERFGVPLDQAAGSRHGKIRKADVLALRDRESDGPDIRPMSTMRKIIAKRMKQSLNENAQASHRVRVRMTEAARCRDGLKAAGNKASFTDLIALGVARALRDHPEMNVEVVPDGVLYKDCVNLGIAVALPEGLVVPVVRDADRMTLSRLSAAIKEIAARAREGTLEPDDYGHGSFTISNLGMFGLDEFTAIINPPESGILAVGKIEPTPVAVGDRMEIHPVMALTLSYDHRVIDGAPAARFLVGVKDYLENPYRLL